MFDVSRLSLSLAAVLMPLLGCGGTTTQTHPQGEQVLLAKGEVAAAPNGIGFPYKYKNWPVLSVNQRPDTQSISVVVGNLEAVRAARKGQTNPWPDGTVIGHLVFEPSELRGTPSAVESGMLVRAEFMFKDVEAYAGNSSGWGWARWDGEQLAPYGEKGFEEECIECHTKVSGTDWLFSKPVELP